MGEIKRMMKIKMDQFHERLDCERRGSQPREDKVQNDKLNMEGYGDIRDNISSHRRCGGHFRETKKGG